MNATPEVYTEIPYREKQRYATLDTAEDISQIVINMVNAIESRYATTHQALQAHVATLQTTLHNVLEGSADGIVAINQDFCITRINSAAVEIVPELGNAQVGTELYNYLPTTLAQLPDFLGQCMRENRRRSDREFTINLSGGKTRVLSVSAGPLRDSNQTTIGAVATIRDETAIRALQERAARQDRLVALGEMAARVAHEIRNPLGGVELFASMIRRHCQNPEKTVELADKIIAASRTLNQIVDDMLAFTRTKRESFRVIPLQRPLQMALDTAAIPLTERAVKIESKLGLSSNSLVAMDESLLARAFLNIMLNAAQVMTNGGKLTVSVSQETPEFASFDHYVVRFADTGPGIPVEDREKVFHPFQTSRVGGTGLGLAIVHQIVRDHDGHIWIEENQPHGAIFALGFPIAE